MATIALHMTYQQREELAVRAVVGDITRALLNPLAAYSQDRARWERHLDSLTLWALASDELRAVKAEAVALEACLTSPLMSAEGRAAGYAKLRELQRAFLAGYQELRTKRIPRERALTIVEG